MCDSELEIVSGPHPEFHLARHREPQALGVDLRAVGKESAIPDIEVAGGIYPGRDTREVVALVRPALDPVRVRRLEPRFLHRVVDRQDTGLGELLVVVDLEHPPRLAEVGELGRILRSSDRSHRRLVGADVIGMRVPAKLVIRRDDLRTELANQANQRLDRVCDGQIRKTARWQRRLGVSFGEARVLEPQPCVSNIQRLHSSRHLRQPNRGQAMLVDGGLGGGIEDIPALSPSAGDDHDIDTFRSILGHRGSALAGFVIRMCVHGHEAEICGHRDSLPYMSSPFTRDQLSPAMRERYGLDHRSRGRQFAVGVVIIAFLGAMVFVYFGVTGNPMESRLVSWDVQGTDHVNVQISIDRPADREAICVLRAQDSNRIDLGYATVVLPPGEGSLLIDYSLRTLAPAYTVELLGCSVDGAPNVAPPQFPPGVVPPEQPWIAP